MATINTSNTGLPATEYAPATPGSSPDKPWFPQPLGSTAPPAADAANWADNYPHENDAATPLPSDWKQ